MAKKTQPEPSHYEILLKRSWASGDGAHAVPAGRHTVAAEIVALIPADLIDEKTPVEA